MKTIPSLLFLAAALLAAAPLATPLSAADGEENVTTVAFSKPAAPHSLHVEAMWADVRITGADVDKVTVRSSAQAANRNTRRSDGLRVIAGSSTFELTEHDNVVYLSQDSGASGGDGSGFDVTVPRDTSVSVKITANGDAVIKDVTGDVEVNNLNGSVRLENVSGGVAADSMNGEISARYAALTAGKTHSFSSMNGEIRLLVPTAAKATFRLRAQNGTVATDFDEKVLVTHTEGHANNGFPGGDGMRFGMEAARVGLEAARAAIDMARDIAREHVDEARAEADESPEASPAPEATPGSSTDKTPKPPKAPKAPRPPRAAHMPHFPTFPAFGGQVVTGTLNGGGVEIRATTMNGEIQIREAK